MVNESGNNKHLVNQEVRFNESIRKIIPNARFICLNFYENPLIKKSPGNNKILTNCDTIEVVTRIPISTKKFEDVIRNAGYRIFDVIYEQDGLHFFVRKAGERET